MTDQEVSAFLTAVPARTGNLATVHADGRLQSAPVCDDVDDGGSLVFNTGVSALKGRNLSPDLRARSASTTSGLRPASCSSGAWSRSATTWTRCAAGQPGSGVALVRLRPGHTTWAFDLAD